MKVSISEFNSNISKYIVLARKEDIFLERWGVTMAVMISPEKWKKMEEIIDFVDSDQD